MPDPVMTQLWDAVYSKLGPLIVANGGVLKDIHRLIVLNEEDISTMLMSYLRPLPCGFLGEVGTSNFMGDANESENCVSPSELVSFNLVTVHKTEESLPARMEDDDTTFGRYLRYCHGDQIRTADQPESVYSQSARFDRIRHRGSTVGWTAPYWYRIIQFDVGIHLAARAWEIVAP